MYDLMVTHPHWVRRKGRLHRARTALGSTGGRAEPHWVDTAGGREQPFYHVVVDQRDRPGTGTNTYVAQDNVGALEGDLAYEAGAAFRGLLQVHADSTAM